MDFSLNSSELLRKRIREDDFISLVSDGTLYFKVVSTDLSTSEESYACMVKIKNIFQKQLPKMPKEYVFKQVFSRKHRNLVLYHKTHGILGGICYRPFYEQNFFEIVFLAVENLHQVVGNGGLVMDLFKEHAKLEMYRFRKLKSTGTVEEESESKKIKYNEIKEYNGKIDNTEYGRNILGLNIYPELSNFKEKNYYLNAKYEDKEDPTYFMTYADNYAIGFFKKQGFSRNIRFSNWVGYIKDYEGGTIMECKLLYNFNYLRKNEMILNERKELIRKLEEISSFNIRRAPIGNNKYNSIYDIPGIKEGKFTQGMIEPMNYSAFLQRAMFYVLSEIKNDKHSWPFLEPVNAQEVPDYYTVIKFPMDLKTMEEKLTAGEYFKYDIFEIDMIQIFKNCNLYNAPSTQFCKCAAELSDKYKILSETVKKKLAKREQPLYDEINECIIVDGGVVKKELFEKH